MTSFAERIEDWRLSSKLILLMLFIIFFLIGMKTFETLVTVEATFFMILSVILWTAIIIGILTIFEKRRSN